MLLYLEYKGLGVMIMKISGKTILYTMRIVGGIIMLAAIGLICYLAWITSHVGLDGFLVAGFGIGAISVTVASVMIYLSFRILFEEDIEEDREEIESKQKRHIHFRKCS